MYKRKIPIEVNCGLDLVKEVLYDLGQSVLPVIAALGKWGDDPQERLRRVIAKI